MYGKFSVTYVKTENNSSDFQLSSHLMIYQQGPYYFGVKVYDKLLCQIKKGSLFGPFMKADYRLQSTQRADVITCFDISSCL
jgi:hypothetical protein